MRRAVLMAVVGLALMGGLDTSASAAESAANRTPVVYRWADVGAISTAPLAFYQNTQESSGGSSGIRFTRGYGKLIGLVVAALLGLGGWIWRQFRD